MLVMHQPVSAQKMIAGFSEKAAAVQKQTEQKFDALLSTERIGQTIQELSAVPHHVGSPGGKIVAEKILSKFQELRMGCKNRNLPGIISFAQNKDIGNVITNGL
jgi:hypothetical protein